MSNLEDIKPEMDKATMLQWAPFLFLNAHVNQYDKIAKEIMTADDNKIYQKLKDAFYSDANMDIIQKQIILTVYKVSEKTFLVDKQNKNSLKVVMDYVYLYYGRNLPLKLTEQIRELNNKTVMLLVPQILTHCQQYMGYLRDIDRRPINDLPVNVSNKGRRTLASVSSTFF